MKRIYNTSPDFNLVKSRFKFERETGFLIRINTGKRADFLHKSSGYLIVKINGKAYPAHLIAWFLETEDWCPNGIDHKDRDRKNNKLSNLRLAIQSDNLANSACHKNNKEGIKGVHRFKSRGKLTNRWRAQIKKNGKVTHLGLFSSSSEAFNAYKKAATTLHGDFACFEAKAA